MKLSRYEKNPILGPKSENKWESKLVFNPAAIYHNGLFHLLYRAMGKDGISRIGYTVSEDGINFSRFDKPVFSPQEPWEAKGCEDPRIVKLEDEFYMTYTAFSEADIHVALASTKNFITWHRHGIIFTHNKDTVLFPEKIDGKFVCFHRKMTHHPLSIWIAYSDDLIHWHGDKIVMAPRENQWDCQTIGAAGPPIKTEGGWLLIYHGVNEDRVYSLGVALFDLNDPSLLLKRQEEPILEPEEWYEMHGEEKNVVFSCGACQVKDKYYLYYGGADSVICLATLEETEIKKFVAL